MYKIGKSGKIIFVIFLVISILLGIQKLTKSNIDRNSYVTLVKGTANINDNNLIIKKKEKLKVNDIIKIGNSGSLAIIEWGEGSITRLGENTTIKISKNQVSKDLTKIEIFFKVLGDSGKTWSNVVSYISNDSYFKQEFADTEAAVRGTIFEVNLDKDYLFVKKHEVILKDLKDNDIYTVIENKPFNIKDFNFIALEKFIINFQDKAWEDINKSLDKYFYENLKKSIDESLKQVNELTNIESINVEQLTDLEKSELYSKLLTSYQNLKPSTISPADSNIYKTKLKFQNVLTKLATEKEKKNILRTSFYDLKEAIDLGDSDNLDSIMKFLGNNKSSIKGIDFKKYLDESLLENGMKNKLNELFGDFDTKKVDDFINSNVNSLNNATDKTINDLKKKYHNVKDISNNLDSLKDIEEKINLNNFLDD